MTANGEQLGDGAPAVQLAELEAHARALQTAAGALARQCEAADRARDGGAERDQLARALEVERGRLRQVFEQAPVAVAVLRGRHAPELVFELLNPRYQEMLPPGRDPLGRALADALPEVAASMGGVLQRVLDTGEPFQARDHCVPLDRDGDGVPEDYYFDFVYHPLVEADGGVNGIIGVGTEVTASVRARRHLEQARERADRLQALTAELAAATTPEAAADVIVAQGVAMTDAATGLLVVRVPPDHHDEGGRGERRGDGSAVVLRLTGLPPDVAVEGMRVSAGTPGPAAACLRSGEAFFLESRAAVLARFPDSRPVWDRLGTETLATVPLAVAGETVGAMSFTWRTPRALDDETRAFFVALGRQAAQALERARLLAAERAARAEAEAARDAAEAARERTERLQALTTALARARSLDDVATVVVADMVVALGARTGALAGRVPGEDALVLLRTVGFPDDAVAGLRRQALDLRSPLAECYRTRAPVWIESRDGPEGLDARYPILTALWDVLGSRSAAFVPLVVAGEMVGVISFSFEAARRFAPAERAFLLALGQQAALAVERARLFEAERAARTEAERAVRAKSEFLAVMSHELRTPLNAIGGYAELLELGIRGPVTELQREDLRRVRRANQHLMGLVTDVLNFARLDAGRVEYHVSDFEVAPLVEDLETLVGPQLAAKALAFAHDACAPDTPESPHVVRADAEKVRQILLNLLTNAIKFTDAGGRIVLRCAVDAAAGVVRLHVSDTGRGIAADQLARIFEPFVQVDRTATQGSQQGIGLGLAISRDLARGMGGDLTVVSAPGAGSTFTLVLPAASRGTSTVASARAGAVDPPDAAIARTVPRGG